MSNETILGRSINFAAARKTVTVECPELDGSFILRELSVSQLKGVDKEDIGAQLALMIVDESGQRVFTSEEDIANLREMNASVGARLMQVAAKLNGVNEQAAEEAKKNLQASPKNGSVSG